MFVFERIARVAAQLWIPEVEHLFLLQNIGHENVLLYRRFFLFFLSLLTLSRLSFPCRFVFRNVKSVERLAGLCCQHLPYHQLLLLFGCPDIVDYFSAVSVDFCGRVKHVFLQLLARMSQLSDIGPGETVVFLKVLRQPLSQQIFEVAGLLDGGVELHFDFLLLFFALLFHLRSIVQVYTSCAA